MLNALSRIAHAERLLGRACEAVRQSTASELSSHCGLHNAIAHGTRLARAGRQYEEVFDVIGQRYRQLTGKTLSKNRIDFGIAVITRNSNESNELAKASKMGRAITVLRTSPLKSHQEMIERLREAGGMEKLIRSSSPKRGKRAAKNKLLDLIVTVTPEQLHAVLACEGTNVNARLSVGLSDEDVGMQLVELLEVESELADGRDDGEEPEGDAGENDGF